MRAAKWSSAALLAALPAGLFLHHNAPVSTAASLPRPVVHRPVSLRLTGTIVALKSATSTTPRPTGSRSNFNRGGDGGDMRGGDFSLTLLTMAQAGARVKVGDVVAQFDPQNQRLRLDDYADGLAQLGGGLE